MFLSFIHVSAQPVCCQRWEGRKCKTPQQSATILALSVGGSGDAAISCE